MKKEAGLFLLSIGIAAAIVGGYIGYTKYKEAKAVKEAERDFLNTVARQIIKKRQQSV